MKLAFFLKFTIYTVFNKILSLTDPRIPLANFLPACNLVIELPQCSKMKDCGYVQSDELIHELLNN